ncbi:MAG: hypothetical protein LUE27_00355 [Clostridia bacterium]|nr:hypothetical protein [Clostridia bacterium]
MTVYELAITLTSEERSRLTEAGLMPRSVERYVYVYEMWRGLVADGTSKMDAYEQVSERCYTCVENVRKIVRRMESQVK